MKDLIITICRDTRKIKLNRGFIGLNGENLQGNIIVDFTDKAEFVDGTAYFEVVQNGKPYFLLMERDGENKAYKLPIKSSLLAYACELGCQVVIRQEETADGIPVFKSEEFKLPCPKAINATETIPEQYPSWIETASAKLAEIDKATARANAVSADLEQKVADDYYRGEQGEVGQRGNLIYIGDAPSFGGLAIIYGDVWIDDTTYDMYQYTANGFVKKGNIKGADGECGETQRIDEIEQTVMDIQGDTIPELKKDLEAENTKLKERIYELELEHKQHIGNIVDGFDREYHCFTVNGNVTERYSISDGSHIFIPNYLDFIDIYVNTAEYDSANDQTRIYVDEKYKEYLNQGAEVYAVPSVGGESAGGTKLYKHDLVLTFDSEIGICSGTLTVISTISTPFTLDMVQDRDNLGIVNLFGWIENVGAGITFKIINTNGSDLIGWSDLNDSMTVYPINTIDNDTVTEL